MWIAGEGDAVLREVNTANSVTRQIPPTELYPLT